MGHNSPRAALIYQHSTEEQQTKISDDIRTRRRPPHGPATEVREA
ncbi:integrase [Streptomyces sp. FH025]|nr:integrase [Streptomyces sp. FH025]MBO1414622.1 integrase [Streptomyces sp. FH025]